MRQIHICAWLLVTCSAFAACGGEEFSSGDAGSSATDSPNIRGGETSQSDDGASEAPPAKAGSKNTSATGGAQASAGTGGSTSSGGASSAGSSNPSVSGGATTSEGGAAGDIECAAGAVTFRMRPSDDLAAGFFCDTGCGSGWLTITDAEGYTAFSISSACGIASCESCDALPCGAAACLPTPLAAKGAELTWTGTYLAKDTCGQNVACQRQTCVKPGKYKAKACAAVSGSGDQSAATCTPKDTQVCAEVTFEFPGKDSIDLVLKKP